MFKTFESFNNYPDKIIELVLSFASKKTGNKYLQYGENFIINKDNQHSLIGKLFLTPNKKAVRFNFKNNKLYCIDLWNDFYFINSNKIHEKPIYTLYIKKSIVKYIDNIVDFLEGNFIVEEKIENGVEDIIIKSSSEEEVKLKTFEQFKNVEDVNLDPFTAIDLYTKQVAYKVSNSLIITGGSGLGKSTQVIETLNDSNIEYQLVKGDISTAGLYEILFLNRHSLLVFDDCDAVWKNIDSINLLAAVLDTFKDREVSRILKTHFDSKNKSDREIQSIYKESGKLPKQFIFDGQIIFISNLKNNEIDPKIISRCLHVDIDLNREELFQRLNYLLSKMFPELTYKVKEEALIFLDYITSNYECKFPLNIRSLIHSINIRKSNDFNITVEGKSVPAWQLLIKQNIIKPELKK
jgi:hypothetical protein